MAADRTGLESPQGPFLRSRTRALPRRDSQPRFAAAINAPCTPPALTAVLHMLTVTRLVCYRAGHRLRTSIPTRKDMPRKTSGEDGVKSKQRKSKDAAKRDFELNGKYSAKSIRMRADTAYRGNGRQSSDTAK